MHVLAWLREPRPSTKWAVILFLALAAFIVTVRLGPIPQPLTFHDFADKRALFEIPNAMDVLSNLPFLIAGALGLGFVIRPQTGLTARQRWAYGTLFLGLILTAAGSAYYHWAPDNQRLFWDRGPMTVAMAGVIAALAVDRFGDRAVWLLPVMLVVGFGSVVQWEWSEMHGRGDMRWYGLYQGLTFLIGAAWLLLFASHRVGTREFVIAMIGNVAAKILEVLDKTIYGWGGIISGHTLKHLSAGLAFFPLVWLLARTRSAGMARTARAS